MSSVSTIFDSFRLTDEEYTEIEKKFGQLCYYIAQKLKHKNSRNNYIEEIQDIAQDIRMSMIKAGCYHKRQLYIEANLECAKKYVKDEFLLDLISNLESLWKNRKRHGANKQCFGSYQENLLECIIKKHVPTESHPIKGKLKIDNKFSTYCKAIAWNCSKNLGKKITRERSIRTGLISLSEHDFLAVL